MVRQLEGVEPVQQEVGLLPVGVELVVAAPIRVVMDKQLVPQVSIM